VAGHEVAHLDINACALEATFEPATIASAISVRANANELRLT
jgi:hypothetical protein